MNALIRFFQRYIDAGFVSNPFGVQTNGQGYAEGYTYGSVSNLIRECPVWLDGNGQKHYYVYACHVMKNRTMHEKLNQLSLLDQCHINREYRVGHLYPRNRLSFASRLRFIND